MTIEQASFLGFLFGVLWLLGMQGISKWIDKKGRKENEERKN